MKFVKENLILVICAAVAVLFPIAALFYPFGMWKSDDQHSYGADFSSRKANIEAITNTKLEIPGLTTMKGVPSDNLISVKRASIEYLTSQSGQVEKKGQEYNSKGRVEIKSDPKDASKIVVTPLLEGKREPHFLPEIIANGPNPAVPMAFKEDYAALFPSPSSTGVWTQKLVGSNNPSTPPRVEELTAAFTDMKAKQALNKPAGLTLAAGNDAREQMEFNRSRIMARAMGVQMYVEPGAFQRRAFLDSDAAPNEQNIFEAFIDSWFQGDVVRAIAMTNDEVLKNVKDPKERNVGVAPVKRLMRITVGNEASKSFLGTFSASAQGGGGAPTSTSGSLFFLGGVAIAPPNEDGSVAPTVAPGNQPNVPDESRSLTGRASGSDYDIVFMQINADIDPAYLNKFLDQLYRQNMGYTVLNIRMKTVDPLDRATNGYIYGEGQVVEYEIMVEGLLFRSWTLPLMPVNIRNILGLVPPGAPVPPAN